MALEREAERSDSPEDGQQLDSVAAFSLARLPFLYRLVAGIPVVRKNLLAPPQRDRGRRRYVRVRLRAGNAVANLIVDEGLDDIRLPISLGRKCHCQGIKPYV